LSAYRVVTLPHVQVVLVAQAFRDAFAYGMVLSSDRSRPGRDTHTNEVNEHEVRRCFYVTLDFVSLPCACAEPRMRTYWRIILRGLCSADDHARHGRRVSRLEWSGGLRDERRIKSRRPNALFSCPDSAPPKLLFGTVAHCSILFVFSNNCSTINYLGSK
jgi:hypothetical protein